MTPKKLMYCLKGFKIKQIQKDEEMWRMGLYNKKAFEVVIAHFAAGIAGKKSTEKYIEEPFLEKYKEKNKNNYKESQEEIAIFEMKQRINILRKQGLPESPM